MLQVYLLLIFTIVEDYYKCTWIFLLNDKTQVSTMIQNFLAYLTNQFGIHVKVLPSDNGTKFTNSTLTTFLVYEGVLQKFSCPCTPQQNGTVERKHQHILNITQALRLQANLPNNL